MFGNLSSVSNYQEYLPHILQADLVVAQFLLAFEKILTGLSDDSSGNQIIGRDEQTPPGLEAIIQQIHTYFDPQVTPKEFLPWLAGWAAVSLRNDWDEAMQRAFIQKIVPLYKLRGTKKGLEAILGIYLKNAEFTSEARIFDQFDSLPNYFQVELDPLDPDPAEFWRKARIAKAIIDQEKPAHTFYALRIRRPTLRITPNSQENYRNYFLTLFSPAPEVEITLKLIFEPDSIAPRALAKLEGNLILSLQGKLSLEIYPQTKKLEGNILEVSQTVSYRTLVENADGFNFTVLNATDVQLNGKLKVRRDVKLNGNLSDQTICFERQVSLLPVLRICSPSNGESVTGTTIFQPGGMRITPSLTEVYSVLVPPPDTQEFTIETNITFGNLQLTPELSQQILAGLRVQVQGKTTNIVSHTASEFVDQQLKVKQNLTQQDLSNNLAGFELQVLNQTGMTISGSTSARLSFPFNQTFAPTARATHTLFTEPIHLPVLRIYDNETEMQSGHTVIVGPLGMQLTQQRQTVPFLLFDRPEDQKFTVQASVTVEQDQDSMQDLLLRIATVQVVRDSSPDLLLPPQDRTSRTLLLTSKSTVLGNKLECKRTIHYHQLMNNVDGFLAHTLSDPQQLINGIVVTLSNFKDNDSNIDGKISVTVYFRINQTQVMHETINDKSLAQFNLPSAKSGSTLRICSIGDDEEIQGNAILGTVAMSLQV